MDRINLLTFLLTFLGITGLHWTLQFLAWSAAPGNAARDLSHLWISKWWPALSFPVFWVLPRTWNPPSEWQVWGAFVLNSILWGLTGTVALALIARTRR